MNTAIVIASVSLLVAVYGAVLSSYLAWLKRDEHKRQKLRDAEEERRRKPSVKVDIFYLQTRHNPNLRVGIKIINDGEIEILGLRIQLNEILCDPTDLSTITKIVETKRGIPLEQERPYPDPLPSYFAAEFSAPYQLNDRIRAAVSSQYGLELLIFSGEKLLRRYFSHDDNSPLSKVQVVPQTGQIVE